MRQRIYSMAGGVQPILDTQYGRATRAVLVAADIPSPPGSSEEPCEALADHGMILPLYHRWFSTGVTEGACPCI